MQENHRYIALSVLVDKAKQVGFILLDDIMDECSRFDLSIQDVDWVSSQIATLNIIVRDEKPNAESDNDDFFDFAHSDYDSVYRRIVEINPQLFNYIESIKLIVPPQYREFSKLKFQILEGNLYARQRCIEMHLRIVLKLALRRYEQFGGEIEDYISDGMVGLIYAVDKYDHIFFCLYQTLGTFDHHLGYPFMVFGQFIKCGVDHLNIIALYRFLDIRNFFRPLIDEQDDQMHFRIIAQNRLCGIL